MVSTRLWHIPISHYNEKARWALELKRVPHSRRSTPPGLHMVAALVLTRGRGYTVPVLELDGRGIGDSTAIIAALEARHPEPPLYPADPAERERALALEDWFDEELGPHIRRFMFHEAGKQPEVFAQLAEQSLPPRRARLRRFNAAYGRALTRARFGAGDAERAERAREKVVAAIDRLEAELGDGDYLVGGRFTIADLTAAALFSPLVRPPEGPVRIDPVPPSLAQFEESVAGRRAYRWVEEIYRRHRRPRGDEPGSPTATATRTGAAA